MEYILQLDRGLFYILNTELTVYFLDFFMPFITTKSNFIEAIVFAWLVIFLTGKWKDRKILIIVIFVVLISDLAANVLKEIIQRVRPCNVLPEVRLLVGCTESFSLPSGHATNAFAVATYLSYTYRRYIPVFFFLAVLVAYSRIYVGVHYPLDVAGGALLGSSWAVIAVEADRRLSPAIVSWFNKRFGIERQQG